MIKFKNFFSLLIGCLLLLNLSGCFSPKFVESKQYLLEIKKLSEKKESPNKCSVALEAVTATAPFDQINFLYRINSNQYITDYYNSFVSLPTEQLEQALINYLKSLGDFNLEVNDEAAAQNKLKVQLTELYADYSDHNHPCAKVTLHFVLTRSNPDKDIILLDKNFHSQIELQEKTTDDLLKAWGKCVQDILKQGVAALNVALATAANC
jgi:uncharacterized lipoprotein YmbA